MNRRFKKKPVEIEAVRLTWRNWPEICDMTGPDVFVEGTFIGGIIDNGIHYWGEEAKPHDKSNIAARITLPDNRILFAQEDDWIIRRSDGSLYAYSPNDFNKKYEPIELTIKNTPLCITCKQELSNGASVNGQPKYFCINPECKDRFKTVGAGSIAASEDRPNTAE